MHLVGGVGFLLKKLTFYRARSKCTNKLHHVLQIVNLIAKGLDFHLINAHFSYDNLHRMCGYVAGISLHIRLHTNKEFITKHKIIKPNGSRPMTLICS